MNDKTVKNLVAPLAAVAALTIGVPAIFFQFFVSPAEASAKTVAQALTDKQVEEAVVNRRLKEYNADKAERNGDWDTRDELGEYLLPADPDEAFKQVNKLLEEIENAKRRLESKTSIPMILSASKPKPYGDRQMILLSIDLPAAQSDAAVELLSMIEAQVKASGSSASVAKRTLAFPLSLDVKAAPVDKRGLHSWKEQYLLPLRALIDRTEPKAPKAKVLPDEKKKGA